jgi:hypothetical protein
MRDAAMKRRFPTLIVAAFVALISAMKNTSDIARAISHQTAQKERYHAAERNFWRRQIRVARWLNVITLIAAIIAIGSVFVLIWSLLDARKATVEANRAWVAPRSVYLRRTLVLNDHPGFRVAYDNIGREPALHTNLWWRVIIVDADVLMRSLTQSELREKAFDIAGENPACAGHTISKGAEIIWPSQQPETYSASYIEQANDPIITQDVIDGRAAVVVEGCFFYETFHEVHHSAFCFWLRQVPPSNMLTTTTAGVICPLGNGAE